MGAKDIIRAALKAPAWLYELGVRTRIVAYDTQYLKSRKLDSAVVSVGNLTMGGTGKTPLVEYIARYLSEEGYSIAILTRGYGRGSRGQRVLNDPSRPVAATEAGQSRSDQESPNKGGADSPRGLSNSSDSDSAPQRILSGPNSYREYGDEPVMLARALPGVPVIINSNRVQAALWAEQHLHPDVIILDDGYQHLALARDLNILVLDATNPFGGSRMVPFGTLREPLFALKRADAVIISRAHRPFDQGQTFAIIKYFCGDRVPVMYVYSSIVRLRHLSTGMTYDGDQFVGWNASIMCAIGNPRAFSDDLLQIGINIASETFYRDHHPYTQDELDRVIGEAERAGADMIVTTEKDAVRLEGLTCGQIPVYAAELELQSEDEVRLKSLLLRSLLVRR